MRLSVVLDCEDPEKLAPFWEGLLGHERAADVGPFVVLVPREQDGFVFILQRVPEPKATKNRMHLDLHTDDLQTEIARAEDLGAQRIGDVVEEFEGISWVVLGDPEGNEFCLVTP